MEEFLAEKRSNTSMNWVLLIIGGLFEVGFTTCMGKAQQAQGATAWLWWAGFAVSVSISMYLLHRASLSLPIGTAYAVWAGVGAIGTAVMGIVLFKEPADFWRLFFIFTLVASIAGLKVVSN